MTVSYEIHNALRHRCRDLLNKYDNLAALSAGGQLLQKGILRLQQQIDNVEWKACRERTPGSERVEGVKASPD